MSIGFKSSVSVADRHFIAFADAQAEKAPSDEIRCLLELAVGHFAVLKHRSNLVAIALGRLVQCSADDFPRPLIVPHAGSQARFYCCVAGA